ncbi:MAG: ATP-binding protein [Nitrospinae bacterium]|nr:ATP-binding protein [Nitrospinota bacterium]MBL7019999.1 ATP-binding protein [Nitrospinaceae bacterium]
MPLTGGPADKLGNRYENFWTLYCILDVMDEQAEVIRLEPPGQDGEGFEFYLEKKGVKEYHQVKRQKSGVEHWSLNSLKSEKILSNFKKKLANPSYRCSFISIQDASQLRELTERANAAINFKEFQTEFLNSQQTRKGFQTLSQIWALEDQETFENLKRIIVRNIDENTLKTHLITIAGYLAEGNPTVILEELSSLVSESIHKNLTAFDIWSFLESRGVKRRKWGKDPHIINSVNNTTKRYFESGKRDFINEKAIPQEEVKVILDWFEAENKKQVMMVTGVAGGGKTSVIAQLLDNLHKNSYPILAFRLDRLPLESILPDKTGEELGLPGSPAKVLAAASNKKKSLLIIDQLDAVSLLSGRKPEFFDCIQEILEEALCFENLRIILVCRQFDLDNDHRFRQLAEPNGLAEKLNVSNLKEKQVLDIIPEWTLKKNSLSPQQIKLLTIPLHLKLLSEICKNSEKTELSFSTSKDLFDLYWDHKQFQLQARLNKPFNWFHIINKLVDDLNKNQILSSPKSLLDEFGPDTKALESENVLVVDNQRYAFFHEGFFDYCFARRFITQNVSIVELFLEGEQGLFRRSQTRQILLHLRDGDRSRYILELDAFLNNPQIRYHLKHVAISLLSQLTDPIEEEWGIIASLLSIVDKEEANEIWGIFWGSSSWFRLLDSIGEIENWLTKSDEETINRAVSLFPQILETDGTRIAEIIGKFTHVSEKWNQRLRSVFSWDFENLNRGLFDLLLKLINEGIFDTELLSNDKNVDFGMSLSGLPKRNPTWGSEALGQLLNRLLWLISNQGRTNPFEDSPRRETIDKDLIFDSAKGNPLAFYENIFPFILKIIETNLTDRGDLPYRDKVWFYRVPHEKFTTQDDLLSAMELAFSNIAKQNPEFFSHIASQIKSREYDTIQFLLTRGYTANGEYFASEAVSFLSETQTRLKTGSASDSYWATRELVESIAPFCTPDILQTLENLVLNYSDKYEKKSHNRRRVGYSQFTLLGGFNSDLLSSKGKQRLQELQRKFNQSVPEKPSGIKSGWVKSPISSSSADKMNDEQWLKAIKRYNQEDMSEWREDSFYGGAHELSKEVERLSELEPHRFANLALRIPQNSQFYYFDAILRGMAKSAESLDVETISKVCLYCHDLPIKPCGITISKAIQSIKGQNLPNNLLDILVWYATEDPDPEKELWQVKTGDNYYYGGDIFLFGLNTVRGHSALVMGDLIATDKNRINYFLPALKKMILDPSPAVRAYIAYTLNAVDNHDRELAVELFITLCQFEDSFLGTRYVENFLFFASQTHFEQLKTIVERMVESKEEDVVDSGTRIGCLIGLGIEEARPLVEKCASGNEAQRKSAAEIFAHNLFKAPFRRYCEGKLKLFFHDPSDEIKKTASNFIRFKSDEIKEYLPLVQHFIESPAFHFGLDKLIESLDETTANLPELSVFVANHFLGLAGEDVRDFGSRKFMSGQNVSKLIIRGYSQASDPALRSQYLDLIDQVVKLRVYGLDEALATFER